jgi:hypothetical protein
MRDKATGIISTDSYDNSHSPDFVIDNQNNLHAAWCDSTAYNEAGDDRSIDIFYKKWDDRSSSWTITEIVSIEGEDHKQNPAIVVDSENNVHVVWNNWAASPSDRNIFYRKWDRHALGWTSTQLLSQEKYDESLNPEIVVDSKNNLHVIWEQAIPNVSTFENTEIHNIFYKKWDNSKTLWTQGLDISIDISQHSQHPAISIDNNDNLHVVWDETKIIDPMTYHSEGQSILYKKWDDSLSSWSPTEVISHESGGQSKYPVIAVDNNYNVHVAWVDQTDYKGAGNDDDIFYKKWNVWESSWMATEVLSNNSTSNSENPDITIDTQNSIHLVWSDPTNYTNSGPDYDLLYKKWDVSKSSWTSTDVVFRESYEDSYDPAIGMGLQDIVYVLWSEINDYDSSGLDRDIFYKWWKSGAGPLNGQQIEPIDQYLSLEIPRTRLIILSGLFIASFFIIRRKARN